MIIDNENFMLYILELEGELNTHQSQLYRIAKEIAQEMRETGESATNAMKALGYDIDNFDYEDLEFIQNELEHLLA